MVASAISRARDLGAQASFEGTVTILFSDIEDSSSLYETLGDLRAHEVIRIQNEIFRQQIAAHRGVEVKALGDSFMIAFSSARRAALCAIAAQRSFAAYCESHPDQPIRVRMGLHVGEAINESADYFRQSGDPCGADRHPRPGRADPGLIDLSRPRRECRRPPLLTSGREAAQGSCGVASSIRDRVVIRPKREFPGKDAPPQPLPSTHGIGLKPQLAARHPSTNGYRTGLIWVCSFARVGEGVDAFLGGGGSEELASNEKRLDYESKTCLRKAVLFSRESSLFLHLLSPCFARIFFLLWSCSAK